MRNRVIAFSAQQGIVCFLAIFPSWIARPVRPPRSGGGRGATSFSEPVAQALAVQVVLLNSGGDLRRGDRPDISLLSTRLGGIATERLSVRLGPRLGLDFQSVETRGLSFSKRWNP